ncbi:MAG TPA: galactokinase family protein, partial [Flavisolibacter sp.]
MTVEIKSTGPGGSLAGSFMLIQKSSFLVQYSSIPGGIFTPMNQQICSRVEQGFKERFGNKPLMVMSPGRVNIIGEHTDYNNGFVLPAAIDKAIYIGIAARNDDRVNLYSAEFDNSFETSLPALKPAPGSWTNYLLGVADQFIKKRLPVRGFDLVIDGDVPIGSGLSSSAAVECATAFGLNEVFGLQLGRKELALLAQKAEHEFAGVMCGIMDQFASVFGKKDH